MHATRLMALAAVVALALPGAPAGAAPLAFPGAVGAAAWAVGGRGGVVIQVTNLNNSGIGSLRACVEATGPRTCVFRVGGTINLISQIRARGTNDFLTIAGQTAPGGGILLRATSAQTSGNLLAFFGSESNFVSDVIVRNIRVRRGGVSPQLDAVEVKYGDNVILDHVSASWGSDETLSIARSRRVTVQHSIIAEGLGSHGFGSLLYLGDGPYTIYRSLYAGNRERCPRVKPDGTADVVNTVAYNCKYSPIFITDDEANDVCLNFVGNRWKPGPATSSSYGAAIVSTMSRGAIEIFQADNIAPGGVFRSGSTYRARATRCPAIAETPAMSAADAYEAVLDTAGAWPRDAVDARLVAEVRTGTGSLKSSVPAYPSIASGTPYPDVDKDGMDDGWEQAQGLSPSNAADRNGDFDGDGYTNLEEFLKARAAEVLN